MERRKKYSCDRCGNGYQTDFKQNLLRHIRNIHEGDIKQQKNEIFKCMEADWCNYQTTLSSNLKRHIQSRHKAKKVKVCEICSQFSTSSVEVMKKHQRTHKDEIVPKHRCHLCNVSLGHNEDFQTHLDNKHRHEQSFELMRSFPVFK